VCVFEDVRAGAVADGAARFADGCEECGAASGVVMPAARGGAGEAADVTADVTVRQVAHVCERVDADVGACERAVGTTCGYACLAAHEITDGTTRGIAGELAPDCVRAVARKSRASRERCRAQSLTLARSRACLLLIIG
jgi:hypothetical protein